MWQGLCPDWAFLFMPVCASQAVQHEEGAPSVNEGRIPCLMSFSQVICSPDLPFQATEVCFPLGGVENGWQEHFVSVYPQLIALIWRILLLKRKHFPHPPARIKMVLWSFSNLLKRWLCWIHLFPFNTPTKSQCYLTKIWWPLKKLQR